MKKNLIKILFCFCMASVIMSGCGSEPKATLSNDTVTVEDDQTIEESVEQSTGDVTGESTEDPVEELTEDPVEEADKDWFAEHDLVITPKGNFEFSTREIRYFQDEGTFKLKAYANVTENTDGVEEGYKEVKLYLTIGLSIFDPSIHLWTSAFDRYTGTSFKGDSVVVDRTVDFSEITSAVSEFELNTASASHKEGFVTIVNGDESYDVSTSFEMEDDGSRITIRRIVTCPIDYNGVVFQIGYDDQELSQENQQIDYSERFYTIDELPYYGEEYYYFSYSNK